MKKSLLSISAFIFLSCSTAFSQSDKLSLNDSLVGFDEQSLIDAAPYRGITTQEMPIFLAVHKREFIKQKYNIKSAPISKIDPMMEAKTNVAACTNEDFEEGSLTSPVPGTITITTFNGINGWTSRGGSNSAYGATGNCTVTVPLSGVPNALQLIAPGPTGLTDAIIGAGYPIHSVFGNSLNPTASTLYGFNCYGDWFAKINNQTPGSSANQITKQITVSPSNVYFNFAYMAVMEGAHCCCDNGAISVVFRDCLGNFLATASQFSVASPAGVGCTPTGSCSTSMSTTILTSTINTNWKYSLWTNSSIDLTPWMGQCINIYVTALDCPYSGHAGYAYFDSQCAPTIINGINSIANHANYKLYPNPSGGIFNIDISKEINNGEIEIRNVLGQIVFRQSVKQGVNSIKTENLAKGIYNYSVLQNKEVVSVGKIVIE